LAAGRRAAAAALQRYEDRVAPRALADAVNLLDPDVIVLSSGLSNLVRFYQEIPKLIGCYLFSDGAYIDLRPPIHGGSSGVCSTAWLWDAPLMT